MHDFYVYASFSSRFRSKNLLIPSAHPSISLRRLCFFNQMAWILSAISLHQYSLGARLILQSAYQFTIGLPSLSWLLGAYSIYNSHKRSRVQSTNGPKVCPCTLNSRRVAFIYQLILNTVFSWPCEATHFSSLDKATNRGGEWNGRYYNMYTKYRYVAAYGCYCCGCCWRF